jgi:hypothetical protein
MPDEKFDEKDKEKREEKSPQEKNWDEKWRRDPLGSVVWAVIFIWAGLVFLASNLGFLNSLYSRTTGISGFGFPFRLEAWSLVLAGAGVILLIEVVVRLLVPEYRRPVGGTLILGFILIGVGLGDLISWSVIWPLIIIAFGLSIIFRGFLGRRSDKP